jgi:hypothetical protein
MPHRFRSVEEAREEVMELHGQLLQLENRMKSALEMLSGAITKLFGSKHEGLPTLIEATLASRIAEEVISRLAAPPQVRPRQKEYLREREAAEFMGVSVSALRSWRLHRSKAGPPFTRLGRMVLYPVNEIENHLRAGLVARRG